MESTRRFSKNFLRRRTTLKLCRSHSTVEKIKHFTEKVFIARMFCLVALVFPIKARKAFSYDLLQACLHYGATIFLGVYVIGDFRNIYRLLWNIPVGLTFCAFFTDIFSITIRITLLCKRQSILSTITYLQAVHSTLQHDKDSSKISQLAIGVIISCTFPSALLWYTVTLCYKGNEKVLTHYVKYTFFGWSADNKWTNCLLFVIVDHLLTLQQHVLSGFLMVLCWYLFELLKQIIESFLITSQQENDLEQLCKAYLKYSKTILNCMSYMEQSLSLLLILVYIYMVSTMFSVTTYLMRANLSVSPLLMVASQVILLFVILIGFYATSFQAVAVYDVAIKVKNCIYEIVSKSDSEDYDMKCLLLTMAADFPSRVAIKVGGLFYLKRNFLQKTTSGIVTYAVLLSQLEHHKVFRQVFED
ncbi:hypothetical protein AVEN_162678-1 [Araneus ventricosus]|uniref:Gustatory receptor n=1 Tax=Araneus ventricosus TaxID=182803 RepID=A0A4Y2WV88_ARAVE|nr:hypothetical protein AVEN_92027-1 [Araneus ventricosus]GBO41293.1 hypothetical protein AVEN_162678-1 [Araneus ventricosus]